MRVEKISLIVVAVCAVIVLAGPFRRSLALRQIEQTMPGRESSIWDCIDPTVPNPHAKTNAQLLKEHPKDFLLRLALAQQEFEFAMSAGSKAARRSEQAVGELLRDYPRRGVVYVLAMELPAYADVDVPKRFESGGITPEEAASWWKDEARSRGKHAVLPTKPTEKQMGGVRRCIALMDDAIAADPGNGAFHYQKALYLFALHSDSEALREIHLAAVAPRFTDYTDVRARSVDHLLDLRGGFDPDKRAGSKGAIGCHYYVPVRDVTKISAHLARQEIQRGNIDRGVRAVLDLTNLGYNMARHAPTLTHGLSGRAQMVIGTSAFDLAFRPKMKSQEAQSAALLAHYKGFLADHGYRREAELLGKQWQETDRLGKEFQAFAQGECVDRIVGLYRYPVVFATAAGMLTILLIFCPVWAISCMLTMRGGARDFWDRRAAVTSGLLLTLILSPVVVDLVSTRNWFSFFLEPVRTRPVFLLIPLGVMAFALLAGLVVMLRRTPNEGANRRMPTAALLIAYLAALGGLAYLAHVVNNLPDTNSFFQPLLNVSTALMLLGPTAAIILYAVLRAAQSRFGRVRRSSPLTFIATLRYSSAIAVGLFAAIYVCTLLLTAHYAVKADVAARAEIVGEASIVQRAFK